MADSQLIDIQDSSIDSADAGPGLPTGDDLLIGSEVPQDKQNRGRGQATPRSAEVMEKPGSRGESKGKCAGISWPWSKRDRLKRDSSMDKVDEDAMDQGLAGSSSTADDKCSSPLHRCPDYFGVRSYLHHFYETRATFKDPDVYEEADDTRHLLNPSLKRHRHCTAIWWKAFVFVGVLFLFVGIVCVLVGYLLPQRPILVGMVGSDKEVIDREAIAYNYNLDACKLVGLILFCLGGLTLAVALMIPSYLYRYCDDDRVDGSFAVPVEREEAPPLQTKESLLTAVPTTETVTEIQPIRKHDESGALLREGIVNYPSLE